MLYFCVLYSRVWRRTPWAVPSTLYLTSLSLTIHYSMYIFFSRIWRRNPWSAPSILFQTTPRTFSDWLRTLTHVLSSSCVHSRTSNRYGQNISSIYLPPCLSCCDLFLIMYYVCILISNFLTDIQMVSTRKSKQIRRYFLRQKYVIKKEQ